MLRVWVCATHMGGFLGPKFSKTGSLFQQIFFKHDWVYPEIGKKLPKMGGFPAKIHH